MRAEIWLLHYFLSLAQIFVFQIIAGGLFIFFQSNCFISKHCEQRCLGDAYWSDAKEQRHDSFPIAEIPLNCSFFCLFISSTLYWWCSWKNKAPSIHITFTAYSQSTCIPPQKEGWKTAVDSCCHPFLPGSMAGVY